MSTLTDLFADGFGPVRVSTTSSGLVARVDGAEVTLAEEAGAVRVATVVHDAWPEAPDAGQRLRSMLDEVALQRGDLTWFVVSDAGPTIEVVNWQGLEGATTHSLAVAVRQVQLLADVARSAITELGRRIELEARLAATNEQLAEAELAPGTGTAAATDQPPPAAVGQPPPAAAASTWSAPTSAAQPPPSTGPGPVGGFAPTPSSQPTWGYVEQPTAAHVGAVGEAPATTLQPGQWYRLGATSNGRIQVSAADGSVLGWAPAASVRRQ